MGITDDVMEYKKWYMDLPPIYRRLLLWIHVRKGSSTAEPVQDLSKFTDENQPQEFVEKG